MNRPPMAEAFKTDDTLVQAAGRPSRTGRPRHTSRTGQAWLVAAALVAGGAGLTSGGCDGGTDRTLTPVGGREAGEVDADRDPVPGDLGVEVDVDGERRELGRDPVEIDVQGSAVQGPDDAPSRAERRQERRERIGDALDNVNVDVNTEDVQVDVE